jgi:hypothetical protein
MRSTGFRSHPLEAMSVIGIESGHRDFHFRRGHMVHSVEELQERIAQLVSERQQLRTSGASRALLERNRVQLACSQWELGQALIERHLPAA